jgi:hypothetical protein
MAADLTVGTNDDPIARRLTSGDNDIVCMSLTSDIKTCRAVVLVPNLLYTHIHESQSPNIGGHSDRHSIDSMSTISQVHACPRIGQRTSPSCGSSLHSSMDL